VRAAVEIGQTVLFVTGHDPVLLVRVLRERSLAAVVLTSWVAMRVDRSAPEHEQLLTNKRREKRRLPVWP
jgi:hypothetical protein